MNPEKKKENDKIDEIIDNVVDKEKAALDIIREYELFKRREASQPHMSYAHEKLRHQIIREGRTDLISEVLNIPADGTPGRLSRNELRNGKNMFISAITLFTRAAMDGGLPEETAYAMSDSYIQNGENCVTLHQIHDLYMRALREFTYAVAQKGQKRYSSVIEKVIRYIHIHLHEKITLESAAGEAAVSPCHLSRIFLKETGMSFVDYIQKERIHAAENMLTYSPYTTAEISEYLNFSTQSYFIKVFKKHVGVTPGQYRRMNGQ